MPCGFGLYVNPCILCLVPISQQGFHEKTRKYGKEEILPTVRGHTRLIVNKCHNHHVLADLLAFDIDFPMDHHHFLTAKHAPTKSLLLNLLLLRDALLGKVLS